MAMDNGRDGEMLYVRSTVGQYRGGPMVDKPWRTWIAVAISSRDGPLALGRPWSPSRASLQSCPLRDLTCSDALTGHRRCSSVQHAAVMSVDAGHGRGRMALPLGLPDRHIPLCPVRNVQYWDSTLLYLVQFRTVQHVQHDVLYSIIYNTASESCVGDMYSRTPPRDLLHHHLHLLHHLHPALQTLSGRGLVFLLLWAVVPPLFLAYLNP